MNFRERKKIAWIRLDLDTHSTLSITLFPVALPHVDFDPESAQY